MDKAASLVSSMLSRFRAVHAAACKHQPNDRSGDNYSIHNTLELPLQPDMPTTAGYCHHNDMTDVAALTGLNMVAVSFFPDIATMSDMTLSGHMELGLVTLLWLVG